MDAFTESSHRVLSSGNTKIPAEFPPRLHSEHPHNVVASKVVAPPHPTLTQRQRQASGKLLKVDVDVYYYVQHPTSWSHWEGRINHSEAFIGRIVVYLEYLTCMRRRLAEEGPASLGLLEAMQDKANKEMIGQLRRLGYYPIRRKLAKHDWIRKIMNIYPIWITLCRCYHLLPPKLTHRAVSLLQALKG